MKRSRVLSIWVLTALAVVILASTSAMAVLPGQDTPVIEGPEYWGVIVVNDSEDIATLRVKRVVNCEVETQSIALAEFTLVPSSPGATVGLKLVDFTIFGDPRVPIITKEKNWESEDGNVFSMDVQIRFVQP
jgi:hypothetical protein